MALIEGQKIGALAAFIIAGVGVILGTRIVTNPQTTRACIAFEGEKPTGLRVTRGVIGLSPQAQKKLGLSPVTDWAYAGIEVQAPVGTELPDVAEKVLGHLELTDIVWDRTAQGAVAPACQVFIARSDDPALDAAQIFPCGCFTGTGTCQYDSDGAGPAPAAACQTNVTMEAGTFTGTGTRRVPCVEFAGWPTATPAECCKPQCSGKTCGGDGCGGTCGVCGSTMGPDAITPVQLQCDGGSGRCCASMPCTPARTPFHPEWPEP